jgi:hypothetical protein
MFFFGCPTSQLSPPLATTVSHQQPRRRHHWWVWRQPRTRYPLFSFFHFVTCMPWKWNLQNVNINSCSAGYKTYMVTGLDQPPYKLGWIQTQPVWWARSSPHHNCFFLKLVRPFINSTNQGLGLSPTRTHGMEPQTQ